MQVLRALGAEHRLNGCADSVDVGDLLQAAGRSAKNVAQRRDRAHLVVEVSLDHEAHQLVDQARVASDAEAVPLELSAEVVHDGAGPDPCLDVCASEVLHHCFQQVAVLRGLLLIFHRAAQEVVHGQQGVLRLVWLAPLQHLQALLEGTLPDPVSENGVELPLIHLRALAHVLVLGDRVHDARAPFSPAEFLLCVLGVGQVPRGVDGGLQLQHEALAVRCLVQVIPEGPPPAKVRPISAPSRGVDRTNEQPQIDVVGASAKTCCAAVPLVVLVGVVAPPTWA
mmetsp:Transcript_111217/g.346658  ORF Transcript_111217/g.346658 Transcript_111217/m.346658 type:complete len:282 (+) Transcript_111217:893-1738(+)